MNDPATSQRRMDTQLTLCGWRVFCKMPFPELVPHAAQELESDIALRFFRREDARWTEGTQETGLLTRVRADGAVLLHLPMIADFLIQGGAEICAAPVTGLQIDYLRALLLGPAFAILCLQRGLVPLRATALEYRGEAVLICGPAGVGKSAVAYALTQRDFRLVSDGIVVVEPAASGLPGVRTTCPTIWLWRAATNMLEVSGAGRGELTQPVWGKLVHRSPQAAFSRMTSCPLRHVVFLARSRNAAQVCGDEQAAADRPIVPVRRIEKHVYASPKQAGVARPEWVAECVGRIAREAHVHHVATSSPIDSAREIAERLA